MTASVHIEWSHDGQHWRAGPTGVIRMNQHDVASDIILAHALAAKLQAIRAAMLGQVWRPRMPPYKHLVQRLADARWQLRHNAEVLAVATHSAAHYHAILREWIREAERAIETARDFVPYVVASIEGSGPLPSPDDATPSG